jgi:Flp pilus assembly protein TadD
MTQVTLEQAMQIAAAHAQAGRWGTAESVYRQILNQNPTEIRALYGLGHLAARAKHPDAISLFQRVISIDPRHQPAHAALGIDLQLLGRHEEAVVCFRYAVELNPNDIVSAGHLSDCLNILGRCEESIALCTASIARRPNDARGYRNLAVALTAAGRFDEAIAVYRRAIAINPDYALAHYELGTALLLLGRFEEGWREYEWRWLAPEFPSARHNFARPRWDGSAATGARRTLLLHAEQGIGDAIQFVRYFPLVRARGWRVIVGCYGGLRRLMQMSPEVGALEVTDQVARADDLDPKFDAHLPLASLPLVLGELNPDTPTLPVIPYLGVDRDVRDRMRQHMPPGHDRKIGLVWAGNPAHPNDRNRSIPLAKLAPLVGAVRGKGWSFFSFQMGAGAAQLTTPPAGMQIVDLTGYISDWADSAALAMEMDLIITVDTAMAHLAGALGKPVWVLLPFVPDFRWMLDREDSPLYPSMRLFRQKTRGDWDEPIGRVAMELSRLVAAARPGQDGPP